MSSVTQTVYMTKMIRAGFEAADVNLFQALCQQCKTDIGESRNFMFLLLDMARHNKVDVLEIVKTGRVCSEQRTINEKFIDALLNAVNSDDEQVTVGKSSTGVLDLTADEELSHESSGSYEETSDNFYNDNPTSAEAYEIDGFVVPDHHSQPVDDDDDDKLQAPAGQKHKLKRLLKRKLSVIPEE